MKMKKSIYMIFAGALLLLATACGKDEVSELVQIVEDEPGKTETVYLTACIDKEDATRATLAETGGAFAFSSGDQIKVYNGTDTYTGTTTDAANSASFAMSEGFEDKNDGFAGFPARLVKSIENSGVTFELPASYAYTEVGGTDPDASKVPCPMIAAYTAGESLHFKQAGAVVRIRLTNVAAGTISFVFPTNVTGEVTLASAPSGTDDGILTADLTLASNVVTITDVPEITSGNYTYITLPVPTMTAPQNIIVVNDPSDASGARMAAITGSSAGVQRAKGRKLSVTLEGSAIAHSFKVSNTKRVVLAPGNLMALASYEGSPATTATASMWRFGGFLEYIGAVTNGGNYLFAHGTAFTDKWVDLFSWQGASCTNKAHGLVNGSYSAQNHGSGSSESLYAGCWETNDNNTAQDGYLQIVNGGSYKWRPMTNDEWTYLLTNESRGAVIGETTHSRFARVTVDGFNGLLIFPDSETNIWTDDMGTAPLTSINQTGTYIWTTDSYTSINYVAMYNAGMIFIPAAGYRISGSVDRVNEYGYSWSNTAGGDKKAYELHYKYDSVTPDYNGGREVGRSVRLVREVTP
jgi:hypothetical protein